MKKLRLAILTFVVAILMMFASGGGTFALPCNCESFMGNPGRIYWDEQGIPHCREFACDIITEAPTSHRMLDRASGLKFVPPAHL